MKKRYLVTYTKKGITNKTAGKILGVPEHLLSESISSITKKSVLDESFVIHFQNLGISSIALSLEEAALLSENKEILAVEEDIKMHILGFPSKDDSKSKNPHEANLWNIELVNAPKAWDKGITGKGVNLAIIDTGIASHPDLVIAGGISYVPGVTSYNDGNGHGTHCAGIAAGRKGLNNVYGVAKDCNLYAVKVLADNGSGDTTWIIAGMEWCVTNKISVASMSLGASISPLNAYTTAVKRCADNGVIVVCASGNGYKTAFPWVQAPANSFLKGDSNASPIAVGAVDKTSTIADFSSRGTGNKDWNPVTVVAPGVRIYSTYLNNGYATMDGTSMACPHVAGLAALLRQKNSSITPEQAKAKITSTATNLGAAPYPNEAYGFGLINCLAAIL